MVGTRGNTDDNKLSRRRVVTSLGVLASTALLLTVLSAAPVHADQAKFYLTCHQTQVREGEAFTVDLERVTNHAHNARFGANWYTDAGTAGTSDYTQRTGDLVWGSHADSADNRIHEKFYTTDDNVVEGNETFTVRFGPTDNVVDTANPDRDHTCEITIIDDDVRITALSMASTPTSNYTYGLGEVIAVRATFSGPLNLRIENHPTGRVAPGLGMNLGSDRRVASYSHWGSATSLVFAYRVGSGDSAPNGIEFPGNRHSEWVETGSWSNFINPHLISRQNAVGIKIGAYGAYDSYGPDPTHKVDGSLLPYSTGFAVTSSPASGDTYRHGETIEFELNMNTGLDVAADSALTLRFGSDAKVPQGDPPVQRTAAYKSGSGTKTLTYSYTVDSGDFDDDGIVVLPGLGGDGTFRVTGTSVDAAPTVSGLSGLTGHKVDGRPYAKSISIASTPKDLSDTYGLGETIQVRVNFDQNVKVSDGVAAVVSMGTTHPKERRSAPLASGKGTDTLVFEYTVQAADVNPDGVEAYLPGDSDITDAGGTVAYYPSLPGDLPLTTGVNANHKVDGTQVAADRTAPAVSLLEVTSDPGSDSTYATGDTVEVAVKFDEDVVVTGAPQLELDIGGAPKQASYSATNGARVSFEYTVQAGDTDSDGIAVGASKLSLNGGTIRDSDGNDADLTHSAVAAASGHLVAGGTPPTITAFAIVSTPTEGSPLFPRPANTYLRGEQIVVEATFSGSVTITGSPQVELDIGGGARSAVYWNTSADGTGVRFRYRVQTGDVDTDGISVGADKITLNGGTITSGSGDHAILAHDAIAADSGQLVSAPGGV